MSADCAAWETAENQQRAKDKVTLHEEFNKGSDDAFFCSSA